MVCHRRAGKTVACVADLVCSAQFTKKQDARFAYIAPHFNQAKDIAWSYVSRLTADLDGVEYNHTELRADFANGARVRLYGADNPDRLRGLYLDGVVLDEYADMDPAVWSEVLRPALSDRQGWAIFIGTPKGRNSFWEIYDAATRDKAWFHMMLRASESGLLPESELADARKVMTEDQYEQEFECSFQAAIIGAYYGREIQAAENDKRIVRVPYEPSVPVYTAWDLGVHDATAIWFAQTVGREVRILDYYESSGVGLGHYVNVVKSKPYTYGEHIWPHDGGKTEMGTGKTLRETAASLGLRVRILPRSEVEDGINAARMLIPKCWFDAEKCHRGVEALRQYRHEWDDKLKAFKHRPLHDWTSHAADAFRYLALGLNTQPKREWKQPDSRWIT